MLLELPINKIICGDAIEVMKTFESGQIDMVLTDPPYGLGPNPHVIRISMTSNNWRRRADINPNYEWDKPVSLEWVQECYRLLKPKGVLATFYGKDRLSYLVDYAQRIGFKIRDIGGWHVLNPTPQARRVKWASALQIWALFRKENGHTFNWQLGARQNVIVNPVCQGKERLAHPTQKPENVIQPFIAYFTKKHDIVLDPFAGSGTTCAVACKMRRRWIGIDNKTEYVEMARRRLEAELEVTIW